jgi:RNA-splicing ligase RtcB
MAHEILLVLGGDNADFLSFAPHGAGRNRSRSATLDRCRKELGSLEPEAVRRLLAQHTPGLDIRWFSGNADLSESPLGYKDPAAVRAQIATFGLATVVAGIRPLGSIMAGSTEVGKRENDRVLKAKETREERRRSNQAVRRGEFDEV